MAAIIQQMVISEARKSMRPFDPRRDLLGVADLIELCFAGTMDEDGQRYLEQMRSAAHDPAYLRWAGLASDLSGVPMTGFVWEQDGRLVGNLTLIPYHIQGRRQYLIANVAVHPDYRRRGIARALTVKGIEFARQRSMPSVWLHVREDNPNAIQLYLSLGFEERARRTSWISMPEVTQQLLPRGVVIVERTGSYWNQHRQWLQGTYPPELTWHLPFDMDVFRPGLLGTIYRFFKNTLIQQVAALKGEHLLGLLTWQSNPYQSNTLWLAPAPEYEDEAVLSLLLHARNHFSFYRRFNLDYPAHRAETSIRAAGFAQNQTLIWMALTF